MDALVIKIQQDKRLINKSFYLALGVNTEGQKELLGIWISENEGAKFWLNLLTEIKNRGVSDIFRGDYHFTYNFLDSVLIFTTFYLRRKNTSKNNIR
jgi:putative transposase